MIELFNNNRQESEKNRKPEPEWTVQRVAVATLVTLAIGFGFFLLYQFYMVVFILFVAITLAVAIRPIVDWLKNRGLPEGAGILVVYLLLLAIVAGFAVAVGPLLIDQITSLLSKLPGYYTQLRKVLVDSNNRLLVQLVAALPVAPTLPAAALAEDSSPFAIFMPAWDFIRTSSYFVFIFGAIGVLAYYWTIEGELITRRLLLLAPINRRDEIRALLAEMGGTIGSYFRGQAILCLVVGLMSLIGYWAVGLDYAPGLALVMTVCEAIPMIGPALGAIPALLVALSTSPTQALWVLGVVIVIQEAENHLLVPRIMNESVGVNPIVSILSIAAFGALFGFGGALLAIPLAAMLQIVLNRLFFHLPSEEEPLLVEQVADTMERNAASKLRLQTQELVLDVRKTLRSGDAPEEPEVEEIEDNLESIANELDALLSRAEQSI
jgi:predicted PurR-regulated permease PerM